MYVNSFIKVREITQIEKTFGNDTVEFTQITGLDLTTDRGFKSRFYTKKKDGTATKNYLNVQGVVEGDFLKVASEVGDSGFLNIKFVETIQEADITEDELVKAREVRARLMPNDKPMSTQATVSAGATDTMLVAATLAQGLGNDVESRFKNFKALVGMIEAGIASNVFSPDSPAAYNAKQDAPVAPDTPYGDEPEQDDDIPF